MAHIHSLWETAGHMERNLRYKHAIHCRKKGLFLLWHRAFQVLAASLSCMRRAAARVHPLDGHFGLLSELYRAQIFICEIIMNIYLPYNFERLLMKLNVSLLAFLFICYSCTSSPNGGGAKTIITNNVNIDSLAVKLPVDMPKINNISSCITDFKYVPLETNSNSLFGNFNRMEIYKNRIYILDGNISQCVFIFDLNGQFIARAGLKGNGPGEIISAAFMAIDVFGDHLVIGDAMQNKVVYFSLDGRFDKEFFFAVSGMADIGVIGTNCLAFANVEAFNNPLPEDLNECRIITTDTLGNITGGILRQKDIATFCIQRSCFFQAGSKIYYNPLFTSDIFAITDSSIVKKYICDYRFVPKEVEPPENQDDFIGSSRYMFEKTALCGLFVETPSFVAFQTAHDRKDLTTFYDKQARKSVTVATHPYYTTDDTCLVEFNWLTCKDDYYVGYINAGDLIYWKDLRLKEGKSLLFPEMFSTLKDDDNIVLVFFKLKPIQ